MKKDNELEVLKKSAAITTSAYNKFLLNEIETAIDEVPFSYLFLLFIYFFSLTLIFYS